MDQDRLLRTWKSIKGGGLYPEAKQQEMHEQYPDVVEDIDPKALLPKGREVKMTCFFDAAMGSEITKG